MVHKSIGLLLLSMLPAASAWALGDGSSDESMQAPSARWQGRVAFGTTGAGLRRTPEKSDPATSRVTSFSAMGDYYFADPLGGARRGGGFRATSGLVIAPRSQVFNGLVPSSNGGVFNGDRRVFGQASSRAIDPAVDSTSLSYIGLGYTGLSARRGWVFNADLGLVSLNAGNAVKLGRVFSGLPSAEEFRDTRVSPVMQLGASYSF